MCHWPGVTQHTIPRDSDNAVCCSRVSLRMKWDQVVLQKPRELVISGATGKKQIEEDNGLHEVIFQISTLNFLEVSSVGLAEISPKINNLSHLTSLVLRGNSLTSVPTDIGNLLKLKVLDLSWNKLSELPPQIGALSELQSLIVSGNQLSELPADLEKWSSLIVVKIDQNKFTTFPTGLLNEENAKVHLAEIHAQNNQIADIPCAISRLTALRLLDMRNNCLTAVPGELGDCTKLKDISLTGNKLSDRRFGKLVDQNKAKQILDYIRSHCPKGGEKSSSGRNGRETSTDRRTRAKDARQRRRSTSRSSRCSECLMDTIRITCPKAEDQYTVTVNPAALDQRKIVACIVRNVDLSRENILKRFLSVQTGLHDGICGKRTVATIAVHDLDKIRGSVQFDVKPPSKLRLVPLGRSKEMSATELYKALMDEAEALRKEKKRSTFSGIHKYLYLLKGKNRFCCLMDSEGTVLSFPPITNSDSSKMTEGTKNLLLEVTGDSQPNCKKVMDALVHAMLKQGLGAGHMEPEKRSDGDDQSESVVKPHLLQVEPVRVVDAEAKLYVVYPSRVDLIFDDVNVVRDT